MNSDDTLNIIQQKIQSIQQAGAASVPPVPCSVLSGAIESIETIRQAIARQQAFLAAQGRKETNKQA